LCFAGKRGAHPAGFEPATRGLESATRCCRLLLLIAYILQMYCFSISATACTVWQPLRVRVKLESGKSKGRCAERSISEGRSRH
jgi:hypothetical protein